MRIMVCIHLDPAEETLVAGAARQEHCGLDHATLAALGGHLGRQVLVRRSAQRLALYTVTAENRAAGTLACPGAVTMGREALARLSAGPLRPAGPAAATSVAFRATLDSEVTADLPEADAKDRTALIERVLGVGTNGGGLAVLAPHGGMIEPGTDRQAERVHAAMAAAGRPARGWLCQGWKKGGDAKSCWHITSAEISGRSFPKLGGMLAAKSDHAVAFHGWTEARVGIGGGVVDEAAHPEEHHRHEALKEEVRAEIEAALGALGPPWSGLPVVLEVSGGFSGRHPDNLVNRITKFGNGVQIEQPEGVRKDARVRDAVAQAVADVYLRRPDV
jgi:phage replication-related protein YjqB (UPF0714/DUF867 family)